MGSRLPPEQLERYEKELERIQKRLHILEMESENNGNEIKMLTKFLKIQQDEIARLTEELNTEKQRNAALDQQVHQLTREFRPRPFQRGNNVRHYHFKNVGPIMTVSVKSRTERRCQVRRGSFRRQSTSSAEDENNNIVSSTTPEIPEKIGIWLKRNGDGWAYNPPPSPGSAGSV